MTMPERDKQLASKIKMLPLQVANQIAAGEVVERPASVVKELIENCLDAGASRIDVVITAGGRNLVSVSDNGSGMVRDDAIMSIERQATSKIRTAEDLDRISTMGFRGEALASIASVSRFSLRTRPAALDDGTDVEVFGGQVQDVKSCGCPAGTIIEVRDLFFNMPARRKFLRSYQTEQAQIRTTFLVQALAHCRVAMSLKCDGMELHRLPSCESLPDRVRDIYGADALENLREINLSENNVHVHGYAGIPTWTRADRTEQYIFINGRPATAPVLYHAIKEAYPPINDDRKPVLFLFIDLPPGDVDVNVHPTKREVRFRNQSEIRDIVMRAISNAIKRQNQTEQPSPKELQISHTQTSTNDFPKSDASDSEAFEVAVAPAFSKPVLNPEVPLPFPQSAPVPVPESEQESMVSAVINMPDGAPWVWCRIIGFLQNGRYALLETDEGYVVLDPKAAHARILYEYLMGKDSMQPRLSQSLLLPQTVSLPPTDAHRVRSQIPILKEMGFGIDTMDADSFIIDAMPDMIGEMDCRSLLADVAKALDDAGNRRGREHWREELIAKTAAVSAASMKKQSGKFTLRYIVEHLVACEMPYVCPRGRPTMVFTPFRELARRFGEN